MTLLSVHKYDRLIFYGISDDIPFLFFLRKWFDNVFYICAHKGNTSQNHFSEVFLCKN